MSKLNRVQNAIKMLEGGRFQKLCDLYVYRKRRFENIVSLGSMEGTDKTTKGIPDSYYYNEISNQYILLMHGTSVDSTKKLDLDIKDAINKSHLDKNDIEEIICCHTSSNIAVVEDKRLRKLASPIKLTLIGIDTLAHDLLKFEYQDIAREILGVENSTNQVWRINEFISMHDRSRTNSIISTQYIDEGFEIKNIIKKVNKNQVFVIKGDPGVGKTRLAVEMCKQLQKDFNVISVKSKDLPVYQDVYDALKVNEVNYLFLDDANTITSLKPVLELLILPEFEENLKVIITIRSYALNNINQQLLSYRTQLYEKEPMSEESIETLIKALYKDISNYMLRRIEKMSRNNPRLAVLAIQMITKNGYSSIDNGKEILINYYDQILEENTINNVEKFVLFILSVFSKLRLDNEGKLSEIQNIFNINDNVFKEAIYELHDKELCDIYQDRVTKISDQSLGDYIFVNFISIEKEIKLRDLFNKLYPKYEKELIQLINVINQFDISDSWQEYLEKEMKYIYNDLREDEEKRYFLTQFGGLLSIEALDFVSKTISTLSKTGCSVTYDEFSKKVTNVQIKDEIILILCRLADTEKVVMSAQLLLEYVNKKQDTVFEAYVAIKEYFNIVDNTLNYLYKRESMIKSFHNLENISIPLYLLMIETCKLYLKNSGELYTRNNKGITITRYKLSDGKYLINHHKMILDVLLEAYNTGDEMISTLIEKNILNYSVHEYENGYSKTVISDLKHIEIFFINNLYELSLRQENIVCQLKTKAIFLKMDFIPFENYIESKRQALYNALIGREANLLLRSVGFEEFEKIKIKKLLEVTEKYKNNYVEIFNQINELMNDSLMNKKRVKIEKTLIDLYTDLEEEGKYEFLKGLHLSDFKIKYYHPRYFTSLISYHDALRIKKYVRPEFKDKWELALLLTSKKRSAQIFEKIVTFIKSDSKARELTECSILDFGIILKENPNIIEDIYNLYEKKIVTNTFFIPQFVNEKNSERIFELVSKDLIRKIYLNSIQLVNVDELGFVFNLILNEQFACDFIKGLHERRLNTNIDRNIDYSKQLKYLWSIRNIEQIIKGYINYLYSKKMIIFVGVDSVLEEILNGNTERSIEIIKSEIETSNNEDYTISLLNLATETFNKDILLEFYSLLKFKKISKDAFRKIHITKLAQSWTGSYVPLLDKEIDLINDIIKIFKSRTEFIPHIKHLSEVRDLIHKKKQEELVKDYLDEI